MTRLSRKDPKALQDLRPSQLLELKFLTFFVHTKRHPIPSHLRRWLASAAGGTPPSLLETPHLDESRLRVLLDG